MVQCEMCGTETASPSTIKVEGAELEVCDECTDFGTEVRTESDSTSSSKYSTSSTGGASSGGGTSTTSSTTTTSGTTSSSGGGRQDEMFDDVDDLAQDFDERVRTARESADMSQEELASDLNEKASLIRKIERGETLPTDDLQQKFERHLDIDLSAGRSVEDTDWGDGDSSEGYTLGDMVERKD